MPRKKHPLEFSDSDCFFHVGLSWDDNYKSGKATPEDETHDLDLGCIVLDDQYNLIGTVRPSDPGYQSFESNIFHSGDSLSGISEFDDEEIKIKLGLISHNIHTIVFFVGTKENLSFQDVNTPMVYMSDGGTFSEFLQVNLKDQNYGGLEGADKTNVLFSLAYVQKDSAAPSGWSLYESLKFVEKYASGSQNEYLKLVDILR